MPCTAPGVRTIIPTSTGSQLRQRANSTASRHPAMALAGLLSTRNPMM